MSTKIEASAAAVPPASKRRIPPEFNIFLVLIGIAMVYEVLGWIFVGQSFLMNSQRLTIMILQVAVIGIISVGVTQVIITGGIDLSSGSVVGITAMIAASVAQSSTWPRALFPSLTDLPAIVPIGLGLAVGLLAGLINGWLIAKTKIPPFIATLGMMVSARGLSKWYTKGQPVSGLTDQFTFIGTGIWPVVVVPRCGSHLSYRAALYPLRQVHLCDRRQCAGGPRLRHQCRGTSDQGLCDCRHACGPCRCRHRRPCPDSTGRHGRHVRTRRHCSRRHRWHLACRRRGTHHRHGYRHGHPRRDDLRLYLPAGRCLLPRDRQRHDHRRRSRGGCLHGRRSARQSDELPNS